MSGLVSVDFLIDLLVCKLMDDRVSRLATYKGKLERVADIDTSLAQLQEAKTQYQQQYELKSLKVKQVRIEVEMR